MLAFDSFLRASLLTTLVYPFPVKLMNNVKFKALLGMFFYKMKMEQVYISCWLYQYISISEINSGTPLHAGADGTFIGTSHSHALLIFNKWC